MLNIFSTSNESQLENTEFILFNPKLAQEQYFEFLKIINEIKLEKVQRREKLLEQKICEVEKVNLEDIKLLATLSLLKDLIIQNWRFKVKGEKVYVASPKINELTEKGFLREQLQIERNKQFNKSSIRDFIYKMEKEKNYKGKKLSVKNLIGSADSILDKYEKTQSSERTIQPYIQIVSRRKCELTGYNLNEIWRYFRYTWSIPYKSTPGRNIFYLIRDAAQEFHPVIGISALGNSVLQLTPRDNYIGWTIKSIKEKLKPESATTKTTSNMKKSGYKRSVTKNIQLEDNKSYNSRIIKFSEDVLNTAIVSIDKAIQDIYYMDLLDEDEVMSPDYTAIEKINEVIEEINKQKYEVKKNALIENLIEDTLNPMYTKKRASELKKLLQTKIDIRSFRDAYENPVECLTRLINFKSGRSINIALQANRKTKIGSNIMEIIVCGAIPPYNELLGGKLVAMLMTSPIVISDYVNRYSNQVSEIASRMKGEKVIRSSELAFLGTTSLYHSGSSQYNRIKIPAEYGVLEYKKLGETEGYSSIYFSEKTTELLNQVLIEIQGTRKINNLFGEGTSPRMRLIRSGIAVLGLPDKLIKTPSKRIVYGIDLAKNTKSFLNGKATELDYFNPIKDNIEENNEKIVDYWKKRWFEMRMGNLDVLKRLNDFDKENILVSKNFYEAE